jgi:ferredoxin
MRIRVNPDLCQGHLRCIAYSPDFFDVDEEGHASAPNEEVPPEIRDDINHAILNCPERAISELQE